jgi:hypothetical protein
MIKSPTILTPASAQAEDARQAGAEPLNGPLLSGHGRERQPLARRPGNGLTRPAGGPRKENIRIK